MGKSAAFRNDCLELFLNGAAIAGLAQNHASPNTIYYISLHAGDPTAGNQSTNEVSYPGYGRVAIQRNTTNGWNIVDNVASPINNIEFGECTVVVALTASYVGFGLSATGSGYLAYCGLLNPSISITLGTIPRIGEGSTITEL